MFYKKEEELEPIYPSDFGGIVHGMAIALFFPICYYNWEIMFEDCDIFNCIVNAFLLYLVAVFAATLLFAIPHLVCEGLFGKGKTAQQCKTRKIVVAVIYIIVIIATGIVFYLENN